MIRAFALALALFAAMPAFAQQQFPGSQPIRIIVPFAPGGTTDLLGRTVGRLWLRSADPRESPRIDPGYLSDPDDVRVLREGFRIAREVVRQAPLDRFRGEELNPGSSCNTAAAIDEHIRQTATTVQHAACTCPVGEDDASVVDQDLRVHGVRQLRVVDASVMPALLNCNIHAAVLAIAEWASDVIRGRPVEGSASQPAWGRETPLGACGLSQ